MTPEIFVRAEMAGFCIQEARRFGGINNMLAIAQVLRNRVHAGWGDWSEVVYNAPSVRGAVYAPEKVNLRDSQVRLFLARVDEVYAGAETEDMVDGALYYTEPNKSQTDWFREHILGNLGEHRKVATVGPVWFFE
jgi:Cell Wall Hydrolase